MATHKDRPPTGAEKRESVRDAAAGKAGSFGIRLILIVVIVVIVLALMN